MTTSGWARALGCLAVVAPFGLLGSTVSGCGGDPAGASGVIDPDAGPTSTPPATPSPDPDADAGLTPPLDTATLCEGADCPTLVKTLARVVDTWPHSSPERLTVVGSGADARVFFIATDGTHGHELWTTDGTTAGTRLVKDILPKVESSSPFGELAAVGSTLYFVLDDDLHGDALWKSDGTAAGTTFVTDVAPGRNFAVLSHLTAVGDKLYFIARESTAALPRVFVSDGTSEGTLALPITSPADLLAVGNQLFVSAAPTYAKPFGLYVTDGTLLGTRNIQLPVTDGYLQPVTSELHLHNGKAYFMSRLEGNITLPGALYASDGTVDGTVEVKLGLLQSSDYPSRFASIGTTLYFTSVGLIEGNGNELWKTDGITTTMLDDIAPGSLSSNPTDLTAVGQRLYFVASIDEAAKPERLLWTTDGTTTKNVSPSALTPRSLTALGDALYFTAQTPTSGRELWQSTGASASMFVEIAPGSYDAEIRELLSFGGKLLFPANNMTNGVELYASDGTPAGTTLLKDIATKSGDGASQFVEIGGKVLFRNEAMFRNDAEPWVTDGTSAGTMQLVDINPGDESSSPAFDQRAVIGNSLYFAATTAETGRELWSTDGTAPGTKLVKDIVPGPNSSSPTALLNVGGTGYFTNNKSLWKTDGTAAGTIDIAPGVLTGFLSRTFETNGRIMFVGDSVAQTFLLWTSDGGVPTSLNDVRVTSASTGSDKGVMFAGARYFMGRTTGEGIGLWKSDGTSAGTTLLKETGPGFSIMFETPFCEHAGLLYFAADTATLGNELWKTDGTVAGTTLVKDINPGSPSSYPSAFTVSGGTLYFSASNAAIGSELWKTDGTEAGTVLVKDTNPAASGGVASTMFDVGGTLVFLSDDGVHGIEPWKSDGTEAGTTLLRDLQPGVFGSVLSMHQPVKNGAVLLLATDGNTGYEIWRTDGTPEGTGLFVDLTAGASSSKIEGFMPVRDRIYFNAGVNAPTGTQLWSFPASALQ